MISLGIDIGGTGCKCVAFRDTGEQIAMSYREYPTKPGEVNLNALAPVSYTHLTLPTTSRV